MRWDVLKTTTATELRAKLASVLKDLEDGPVLVLSHSRPVAVLVEPELFDAIMEKIDLLEDILDGRRAMAEYLEDREVAVDAEEVFDRLGH
jgi:prevent-host-death family protein